MSEKAKSERTERGVVMKEDGWHVVNAAECQWYASEKLKRSVLPASFFQVSIVGALLLFVYAIYRVDWVMMAAYAFNPIPYARNLVLLRRQKQR